MDYKTMVYYLDLEGKEPREKSISIELSFDDFCDFLISLNDSEFIAFSHPIGCGGEIDCVAIKKSQITRFEKLWK
jgi:hypothetical protein